MRICSSIAGCLLLSLSACSFPHPLQDDVTRLPLSEIIRKITCEAKDALDDLLAERGLSAARASYKEAKKKLNNIIAKVLKPRQDETKTLRTQKRILDFRLSANSTDYDAFMAALAANPDGQVSKGTEDTLARIRKDRAEILRRVTVYTRAVARHNNAIEAAQKAVDAATKVARKQTEALAQYYNQQIAYSFRFRIVETDSASATAAWKLPAVLNNNPGSWTIGGNVGDTKARESERNAKLLLNLEDIHGLDCSDAPQDQGRLHSIYYPIRGKIGVKEVIGQYFALLDRAKRDRDVDLQAKTIFAKTDAYTDNILFTTTISGSLTPSISLNPTLREQFTASAVLSGSRVDYHSVLISLAAPNSAAADNPDAVQRVVIVSDDGVE